jgi:hypothetical protein
MEDKINSSPYFEKNIDISCSFFMLLPKISPNLGYIFTPRPSYIKVLDPPLYIDPSLPEILNSPSHMRRPDLSEPLYMYCEMHGPEHLLPSD